MGQPETGRTADRMTWPRTDAGPSNVGAAEAIELRVSVGMERPTKITISPGGARALIDELAAALRGFRPRGRGEGESGE